MYIGKGDGSNDLKPYCSNDAEEGLQILENRQLENLQVHARRLK